MNHNEAAAMSSSSSNMIVPAASAMNYSYYSTGIGYGIAIAVSIMVLVSTVMLASYVCVRIHGRRAQSSSSSSASGNIEDAESGSISSPAAAGIYEYSLAGSVDGRSNAGSERTAAAGALSSNSTSEDYNHVVNGRSSSFNSTVTLHRPSLAVHDEGAPATTNNAESTGDSWVIGGLDDATLESYPTFRYAQRRRFRQQGNGGDLYNCDQDPSCSICLTDYRHGEIIRVLPDCCHSFHAACVDTWLRLHASCPMCRTSPLPTPVSTPLSELVPLARHGPR